MKLREKMASGGSSIDPMPSRQYGRYQQNNETLIKTPPTAVVSSTATSPTAVSPLAPLFPGNLSYPPIGAKFAELDVERNQKPWVSTRRRYYEIDDDDDDAPPPTPPPKPREDRLGQVPHPSSIPEFIKQDEEQPRTPFRKQAEYWRNQRELEEPRRAHSQSSRDPPSSV
ncbi:MAG: hypothetical protein Q9195_007567 [Heterodermia aff. obscurata]